MNTILSNLGQTASELARKAAVDTEEIYTALDDDSGYQINELSTLYDDGDAFVLGLQRLKADKNLERARVLSHSSATPAEKQDLRKIGTDLLFVRQYELEVDGREQQLTSLIKRRETEEIELERERQEREALLEGDQNLTPQSHGLRKRGAHGSMDNEISQDATLQTKLRVDENEQDDIANDVLSLVRRMKQNAVDMNQKLAKDDAMVKDTAAALESSSTKMGSVGQKMNEYQRTAAIGYFFYIKAVVFMVVAVAGGMIIIRLFPKW
jgi:SNARE protein 1